MSPRHVVHRGAWIAVRIVVVSVIVATCLGSVGPKSDAVTTAATHVGGPHLRTIAVGPSPGAMAVDERTGYIFVLTGRGVTLLALATETIVRTVRLPAAPTALVVDVPRGHVFVACSDGTVRMLDARTGQLLHTAVVLGSPTGIALAERPGRVFVAWTGVLGTASVSVLSAGTGRFLGRKHARGKLIAVDDKDERVFVVDEQGGETTVLDAATGGVLVTTVGPHLNFPDAMAVDQRTGRVFVNSEYSIAVLNGGAPPGPRMYVGDIPVNFRPGAMLLDTRTRRIYIVAQDYLDPSKWEITVASMDATAGSLASMLPPTALAVPAWPLGADEGTGRAYVINPQSEGQDPQKAVLSILDGTLGRVIHTLTVGIDPTTLVVAQTTHRVFVANTLSGTVSVFDASY